MQTKDNNPTNGYNKSSAMLAAAFSDDIEESKDMDIQITKCRESVTFKNNQILSEAAAAETEASKPKPNNGKRLTMIRGYSVTFGSMYVSGGAAQECSMSEGYIEFCGFLFLKPRSFYIIDLVIFSEAKRNIASQLIASEHIKIYANNIRMKYTTAENNESITIIDFIASRAVHRHLASCEENEAQSPQFDMKNYSKV